jgi:serine/threonine-protein kinase
MIGERIAHYRLTGRLGAGAMGVVYRARDERLGRDIALKLLPADAVGDETARKRLEREARTASALNHPHICTIYDVGEAGDQLFVAMELVSGRPLNDLVAGRGLPEATVVRIGMLLADALDHAHQHGIIHRDLKTANVVMTQEGRPKILDFGLAVQARVAGADDSTMPASPGELALIAGTVPYMAPEVLRGEPAAPQTDLWALGVMLYEMCSGERPFRGATTFAITSAILRDEPPPLPMGVSTALTRVIAKCLDKEPPNRYQRAGELRAALEAVAGTFVRSTAGLPARPRRAALAIAAAIVLAGVAAVLFGFDAGGLRERLFSSSPGPVRSIAVLPLQNLSGDPEQDYFSDGMTDALISDLAQIRALRVISRTSIMRYKGSTKSLPDIARELGVDAVVEGSVVRAGDNVRVTAQLIHAATDTHLWARNYERRLSDVLRLQADVAGAIADEIRIQVSPTERARLTAARSVDPAAHEAFLLGRHFWNTRTEDGLARSIQYFQKAIDADPGYALAYVGLADSYAILAGYGPVPPHEAMPKAKAAALTALELDGDNAEARASLAYVLTIYDYDWSRGEQEFKRAIALNPGYATARHWYGHHLMFVGRFDEAVAEMRRARELDPLSPIITTEVGYPRFFARQYDQAIDDYRRALDLNPTFFRAHWLLGQAYEQKRMFPEAVAALERAVELSNGNLVMTAALAHARALAGMRAEAEAIVDRLERVSRESYFSPYFLAEVHLALGHTGEALDWLDKAYAARDYFLRWLRIDPRLDPLRSQARFQALERRLNFPK